MKDFLVTWLASIPALALPYALASVGLIVSERAGVLSLGAEGLMLVGALAGVGAYLTTDGSAFLAIVASMAAAGIVSLLFAVLVVWLRVNQVIAGLALVFFCQGLTNLVGTLADWSNRAIPGIAELHFGFLSDLPVVGPIFFRHDMLIYLLVPICFAVHYFLNSTTYGLKLKSVGENPDAADAAGINVSRVRFLAVVAGALLVGLAGGYLSVVSAKIWVAGMTSGRGWIAVALVIFARWKPIQALAGAILFGAVEALIPQLNAAGVKLPQYYLLMTPYLATFAVMIWQAFRERSDADGPASLGQPYIREERT
ncbi:ABC transporter permease [Bradyrhizobium sp. CCGUVB1N3]|uniref:ABC transporter permease n=1 Tax=Bradyrhizobium sp. CCGUVB1N3 TaxID=2949629 RepID=UPI0020B39EAB|nr:ABC transporter permease [Bradyrhizobium sp. CCGUVB1N3]MCP3476732.1 ABC transporter permease [Bradyrhizobium sp. CCGUVB1N3]